MLPCVNSLIRNNMFHLPGSTNQRIPCFCNFSRSTFSSTFKRSAANFNIDGRTGTLVLDRPVFDDLSGHLAMREQLAAGSKNLMFEVVDKDTIKTYRYQVTNEAVLNTAVGKFNAVKLVRIRDDNPKRKTEVWLAKDYDFIMLKLVQEEPNNDTIKLDIIKASFNGAALRPG